MSKRSTPAFWRNPPVRSHSAEEETEAQRKGGNWSPVLATSRRQDHAGSSLRAGAGSGFPPVLPPRPLPWPASPLSMRQDHGELSGMQVAETHARRHILSESPCGPQGGLGPCTPGPQLALRPVFPRPGSSGSTVRPPCCSLGTHRGSGSRNWPVSRPRFRFLGERRGLAQLGWGESFPPRPWQAVSRGAAAVRTRLQDPLGSGDPGLPAAGGGSHTAFSCDGPVNGTTRVLRVGAGLWLS